MKFQALLALSLVSSSLSAQIDSTRSAATADTIQLNEVVVRGYETNRPLLETAASISLLNRRDLNQRFGTPTLVPAFNTLPGVRADERSPGSYRLSIRGSLIRSPFGVRNVKVYWNEIPLTDAGGNTPLNALDVRALGGVEVIKGPSGSIYGAGTGGVVLFKGLNGGSAIPGQSRSSAEVSSLVGSYGLFGNNVSVQTGQKNSSITASYNHLQSSGYRTNSALARDNVNIAGTFSISPKQSISALAFYSDLFYQTPGGLTQAQFQVDPRQSRPATRTLPGSAEQGAAIYQKLGFLGVSHEYRWNERWQNTTVLYTSLTDFTNPFITNYERRVDQGMGGRTVTRYQLITTGVPTVLSFGGELLRNFTISRNFGNKRGQPDTLQSDDELRARQSVLFAQLESTLPLGFILTAGVSRNDIRYSFTRFSTRPVLPRKRSFDPVWLPRVALLKKITDEISVFGSISTGYSAPTTQEVRPSDQVFNASLDPERGISYEIDLRGSLLDNRLRYDLAAYYFGLRQTIVRRTNEAGAEFFTNAGRTDQKGLETHLSYDLIRPGSVNAITLLRIWNSLTLTNYRYRDYRQGTTDVSGKRVPGIAPVTNVSGADLETKLGLYAHTTFQFLSPFPLEDANMVTGLPTRLLTATLGFRRVFGPLTVDVYASGDNLLDQTYSLGYDLNAVGNRYFNAAPRRNFIGGLRIGMKW